MKAILLLGVLVVFILTFRSFSGRTRGNPVIWFAAFNCVMSVGIILIADLTIEADWVHVFSLFLTSIAFAVGGYVFLGFDGTFGDQYQSFYLNSPKFQLADATRAVLVLIVIVGLLISAYYFYKIGYILAIDTIVSIWTGEELTSSFATRRLAGYASRDIYRGAGYVNQFKNILVPLCLAMLIVVSRKKHDGFQMPLLALAALAFIFLLGTGQKGAFVQVSIVFLCAYRVLGQSARLTPIELRILFFAVFIYSALTLIQGRVDFSLSLEGISSLFERLSHRALGSNQISAIVGFRYVYELETVWGQEWWQGIKGLSPWHRGSDLSNIIFAIMFVSERGTSPISIWGSAYYNVGLVGMVAFSFIWGAILALLYKRMLSGPRSFFRTMCYVFIFAQSALWVAGGPIFLVNNGIVTVVILRLIGYATEPKQQEQF